MTNILTVIPARGGSKGVPGKNLRLLSGRPLVAHVIRAAKASRFDMRVVCSTDCENIAAVAKTHGAEIPFIRPREISGDAVPAIVPVQHALKHFDDLGWRADIVMALHPTSPFLSAQIIDDALTQLLEDETLDAVVGVCRIEHNHPFRAYGMSADGLLEPLNEYTSEKYLQKQDRPDAFGFIGGLYVRRRHLIEAWAGNGFALGERTRGVVVPPERALDIDSELDFLIAQMVMDYLNKKEEENA